ncbi:hypothetical protein N8470_00070 [bacterium]|jgi:hypothetical protein|nr:hypothetical protein [bacterium]MDA8843577.1 hypothetical protein [Euryarchaeota archaeon]
MTEQNEELLAILKALTEKIENLEKTVYHQDNLLMKSGLVVSQSPSPNMNNGSGISSPMGDVGSMDWSDIHKMVEKVGGQ